MYKKYIHAGGDENEQTSGRNPLKFAARLAGQLKAAKLLSLPWKKKEKIKLYAKLPLFISKYIFSRCIFLSTVGG